MPKGMDVGAVHLITFYCPTDPSEVELMQRFAKIGVGAGQTFDVSKLSPEVARAMQDGMADAWGDFAGLLKQFDEGKVTSADVFGTRKYMKNNYLYRMGAAVLGIYGNSKEDAIYPIYNVDEASQKLTAPTIIPCDSSRPIASGQCVLVVHDV